MNIMVCNWEDAQKTFTGLSTQVLFALYGFPLYIQLIFSMNRLRQTVRPIFRSSAIFLGIIGFYLRSYPNLLLASGVGV